MDFRKLSAGSISYGTTNEDTKTPTKDKMPNVNFQSDQFWIDFVAGSQNYDNIQTMMLGLVLNHGIALDLKGNYLASSPDELALLNAAKHMGVVM